MNSNELIELMKQHKYFRTDQAEYIDYRYIDDIRDMHSPDSPPLKEIEKAIRAMLACQWYYHDPVNMLRQPSAFINGRNNIHIKAEKAREKYESQNDEKKYKDRYFDQALDWYYSLPDRIREYVDFWVINNRNPTFSHLPWPDFRKEYGINRSLLKRIWFRRERINPDADSAFNSPQSEYYNRQ